jgi:hypothetical protein
MAIVNLAIGCLNANVVWFAMLFKPAGTANLTIGWASSGAWMFTTAYMRLGPGGEVRFRVATGHEAIQLDGNTGWRGSKLESIREKIAVSTPLIPD